MASVQLLLRGFPVRTVSVGVCRGATPPGLGHAYLRSQRQVGVLDLAGHTGANARILANMSCLVLLTKLLRLAAPVT